MGKIADHIATMRGCSLAQIVAEIARMESEPHEIDMFGAEVPDDAAKVEAQFLEFWVEYPRKVAKPAALKAYRAARKRKATHGEIMAGLRRFVASSPDPQYTPHAATWLNGDRWNDTPTPKQMSGIDAARERLRQKVQDEQQRTGDREFGDRGAVGLRLGVGPQRAQHQQLRLMPR